ncbi:methyltransferase domain-containing protein [Endothiovibrio diazotrophicus]
MSAPSWFSRLLACPLHHAPLQDVDGTLICTEGCRYPVVHSVPVLLDPGLRDFPHPVFATTLDAVADGSAWRDFGDATATPAGTIDPWVQQMVGATNSNLYAHLVHRLTRYPLPRSPFPPPAAEQEVLLDLGCGWGRWSLAAALAGHRVVGIDPSLRSVLAATRVARQLGLENVRFVVGDARRLPFRSDTFDRAFSFSVLQHFPKEAVVETLGQLRRVIRAGGESRLHLLNAFGVRSLQVQAARGFRGARDFEVRYWRPAEMLACFGRTLGTSRLEVDGFLVQAREEDRDLLTATGQRLLDLSATLNRLSRVVPGLWRLADNLFVVSRIGEP